MKKFSSKKNILITGGTGSFGQAFTKYLLKNFNFNKIIIYSRDELKQFQMSKNIKSKNLRFFIGDVRDKERINMAFEGVDYIVHAAALKQVTTAEYNPYEFIKTNILGAQNVIDAAINNRVENIIALSTDKASAPINLYGATKLCSDKLFTAANNIVGNKKIKFSVVRYGNVMFSRGSVIPEFLKQKQNGCFFITDAAMTRFNITLDQSIDMVIFALKNNLGGEIFIPKIPSYKVIDLAKAICSKTEIQIIGSRYGEKIHEDLISKHESSQTIDIGKYYILLNTNFKSKINQFLKFYGGRKVSKDFFYDSYLNKSYLNIKQLKKLLELNKKVK